MENKNSSNNELMLVESKTMRDKYMDNDYVQRVDEILNKVKRLISLANGTHVTTEMTANFYEVGLEAINSLIKDHRSELVADGLTVLEGEQLKSFKIKNNINSRVKSLTIIPKKVMLKISILLADSEISRQVREELLIKDSKLYEELSNGHRFHFKRLEQKYGDYLDFSFGKENISKQVKCNNYIIDYVLFKHIAIEIDENNHSIYSKDGEIIRENYIKEKGYHIIRFNPHKQKPYELIKMIINLTEVLRGL